MLTQEEGDQEVPSDDRGEHYRIAKSLLVVWMVQGLLPWQGVGWNPNLGLDHFVSKKPRLCGFICLPQLCADRLK